MGLGGNRNSDSHSRTLLQSTSSNSAVPTVTLLTTSLLYVLTVPRLIIVIFLVSTSDSASCSETRRTPRYIAYQSTSVIHGLYQLVSILQLFRVLHHRQKVSQRVE